MTVKKFPNLPYPTLRDTRPKRINSRRAIVEVVELADKERAKVTDLADRSCCAAFVQWHLHKYAKLLVGDEFFRKEDGTFFAGIDAYCDFEGGRFLKVKEGLFANLIEDNGSIASYDAREVFAHEFGHLCNPSHSRKLIARAAQAKTTTGKRAARNLEHYDPDHIVDQKVRNLDLEEEADVFCYAFLVPVNQLDGSLSLKAIQELYSVSPRVAYQAALLSREYQRNKLIVEVG